MNAHTPISAAEDVDDAPPSQALATLENIDDICAGRDRAIDLWVEAHRGFHASMSAIAHASIAGSVPALRFTDDRHDESGLAAAFGAEGTVKIWQEGAERWDRKQVEVDAEVNLRTVVTRLVDRRCWQVMADRLGIDKLLDRQAREEFHEGLQGTPPIFNPENVRATFETVWASRRDLYLRGIANVFMALDRRFRSHDAFAIGNRVVFSWALSDGGTWWSSYQARDAIDDVERVFRELDNVQTTHREDWITNQVTRGPGRYENDYFKADAFKNRNVHLWMKRKDLLAEVNRLLLEYYNPVEGDVSEDGPSYETGPLFHQTPAKHYGFFPSPAAVVEAVIAKAPLDAREDWAERIRNEWQPKTVLEPSAGTGALAKAARAKGHAVTCIEVQPHLAALLRSEGFNTREANFLKLTPSDTGLFDVVIMNPPFDRGRDCDHVRHAYRFLKPGGTLVAVMSARAEFASDKRHAALHDLIKQTDRGWSGRRMGWDDLPERSFAECGTNVNTVTLTMRKPL